MKLAGLGQGIMQASRPQGFLMPLLFGVGVEADHTEVKSFTPSWHAWGSVFLMMKLGVSSTQSCTTLYLQPQITTLHALKIHCKLDCRICLLMQLRITVQMLCILQTPQKQQHPLM